MMVMAVVFAVMWAISGSKGFLVAAFLFSVAEILWNMGR